MSPRGLYWEGENDDDKNNDDDDDDKNNERPTRGNIIKRSGGSVRPARGRRAGDAAFFSPMLKEALKLVLITLFSHSVCRGGGGGAKNQLQFGNKERR